MSYEKKDKYRINGTQFTAISDKDDTLCEECYLEINRKSYATN